MPLSVSHPFFKIGLGCVSVFSLLAANAGAHDVNGSESQFGRFDDIKFILALEDKSFSGFDSKNPGKDFVDFGLHSGGSDTDSFSKWKIDPGAFAYADAHNSGKTSDHGDSSQFFFDKHGDRGGQAFDFGNPWCAWSDDRDRHSDGNGDSGNGCGDTGNNGCGDPSTGCGGDPGNLATPEPGSSYLSLIAAGAMALLLVGRQRTFGKRG